MLISCRCFPDPVSWYTGSLIDGVGVIMYNLEDMYVLGVLTTAFLYPCKGSGAMEI